MKERKIMNELNLKSYKEKFPKLFFFWTTDKIIILLIIKKILYKNRVDFFLCIWYNEKRNLCNLK